MPHDLADDGCLPLSAIAGGNQLVPLLDGRHRRYVNLDSAASTPALVVVRDGVDRFLEWYSSVHRGAGFKSQLATKAYEDAREIVAEFFGADLEERTVIFGKNTTEAINKLSYRLPLAEDQIVLSTVIEHHSNMLPWRQRGRVALVDCRPDGTLDLEDLAAKLDRFRGRVRLVAVTGASNVTGCISPLTTIARMAHEAGAELFVDAAQLAPHRPIAMRALDDPERIDYLAVSGHKLYAPFGTGALIGPRSTFARGIPEFVGGGQVEMVMQDEIVWSAPPDRDEAGSPNVVGAVALALALKELSRIGMDRVAAHEITLTRYALQRMGSVPNLRLLGDCDPDHAAGRTGVISFLLEDKPSFLVAAILSAEAGVAVRAGCFCAHPYLLRLLQVSPDEQHAVRDEILAENRSHVPGAVRASFGIYSACEDVDALADALTMIAENRYCGSYTLNMASGTYTPDGFRPAFDEYFALR
jgi:cysteine desulfurase / selenocysteine lyase